MRTTQVPRTWNLQVGDRVRYRDLRLRTRGTVVEELTPQCVVVHWDGLQNSSVHDRCILEVVPEEHGRRAQLRLLKSRGSPFELGMHVKLGPDDLAQRASRLRPPAIASSWAR
jgi:hypothetical protein